MQIYTVKRGDSLEYISMKFWGDADHVGRILDDNPSLKLSGGRLFENDQITINVNKTKHTAPEDNQVRLFIDGEQLIGGNKIVITNAFDSLANGGVFRIPNNPDNRAKFKPYENTPVTCFYGSKQLINGYMEKVTPADLTTLEVAIYNYAQNLTTCNLPPSQYPRTLLKSSLKNACDKFAKLYNVESRASPEAESLYVKKFDKLSIEGEQTIADFLVKTAQQRNLVMRPDNTTGGILFDLQTASGATLDLGVEKIYSDFRTAYDSSNLYKELTGIKHKKHDKDEQISTIKNAFIKLSRFFVRDLKDGEGDSLKGFITNINKQHMKNAFNVNFRYPDVLDNNGKLIESGDLIILQNDSYFIYKETKFIILNVKYDFDLNRVDIEAQPFDIFKDGTVPIFWEANNDKIGRNDKK